MLRFLIILIFYNHEGYKRTMQANSEFVIIDKN
jgi:hypothetical protein